MRQSSLNLELMRKIMVKSKLFSLELLAFYLFQTKSKEKFFLVFLGICCISISFKRIFFMKCYFIVHNKHETHETPLRQRSLSKSEERCSNDKATFSHLCKAHLLRVSNQSTFFDRMRFSLACTSLCGFDRHTLPAVSQATTSHQ